MKLLRLLLIMVFVTCVAVSAESQSKSDQVNKEEEFPSMLEKGSELIPKSYR